LAADVEDIGAADAAGGEVFVPVRPLSSPCTRFDGLVGVGVPLGEGVRLRDAELLGVVLAVDRLPTALVFPVRGRAAFDSAAAP
jgi:hypothetical protein